MSDHTKEPWPCFEDIATQMRPVNDVQAAIISPEDYIRARICVNAFAGMPQADIKELSEISGGVMSLAVYADDLFKKLSDLSALNAELVNALSKIEKWEGELPETGRYWDDGTPMSYKAAFGSDGERDYMRQVAAQALEKYKENIN